MDIFKCFIFIRTYQTIKPDENVNKLFEITLDTLNTKMYKVIN